MISLRSAVVSEWTCPLDHLDALDDDWMKPAYLSFTWLLTMFCKSRIATPHGTQRNTNMHIYTITHTSGQHYRFSRVKSRTTASTEL